MRIHTWATLKLEKNKPRFVSLSLCIFHALYRGFGIALRMDLESEDKKGFGASGCSPIYAILIFMFHRVGIPCLPCVANRSWFLISRTGRGSLTRRGRLRPWSWTHLLLDLWQGLHNIGSVNGYDTCWYVAWEHFVRSNSTIGIKHHY